MQKKKKIFSSLSIPIVVAFVLCILFSTSCNQPAANSKSRGEAPPIPFDSTVRGPEFAEGEKLYKENCVICHKLDADMTGPALYGAEEHIPGGRKWIYEWVRNSGAVLKSGDKYANMIYEKWNKGPMTPYPYFTDQQIDAIMDYIKGKKI